MGVHRITYISTAVRTLKPADIQAIVDTARVRNARLGVTGVLLFNGLNFLQTLEGDVDVLRQVLDGICGDHRHSGVVVILDEAADRRVFSSWSMGFEHIRATANGHAARQGNGFAQAAIANNIPPDLMQLYTAFDTLTAAA